MTYQSLEKIINKHGVKANHARDKWSKELISLHMNLFFDQYQRIPKREDFMGSHSRGALPFSHRTAELYMGKTIAELYYEWETAANRQITN